MIRKNNLSADFLFRLKEITSGYLQPDSFDELIIKFEHEIENVYFTDGSEANLHRIIFSLFDKVSFLSDCLKYPHYISILISIAHHSNYLTDVVVRNPEFLYWVTNPDTLRKKINCDYLDREIHQSLERFKTFNSKVNYLRLVKRREMLRIGVNDILGNFCLKETTEQLSLLAKALNAELFSLCHKEIENKYGLKLRKTRYCLAALGKLGGNELNYSSDIDLILFFDKNNAIPKISKEYYEILIEAAYLFIQNSTSITDKGYLFRVDFRLRPDGRNSPLCRTLKDYIQYYESRGEDWERQMLIKMSFVGGSAELFNSFLTYIQHFIYPSSFSVSPLIQISRIKKDIEKKIGATENVKLFSGGIRDIEFSIQALQLLNGGKIEKLKNGNSLEVIEILKEKALLSDDEAAVLTYSYEFYRKIEHFLQLMNDRQTHVIPTDPETLEKLSLYMGYTNPDLFKKKIDFTRKNVRKIFNLIISELEDNEDISIENIKFAEPKKAFNNLKYLQTGQGLLEQKQFDKLTISAFYKIEKQIIKYLNKSFAPDNVLNNLARVIKTRPLPSIWYNEFVDEKLFTSFLKLCEVSSKSIEQLIIDKSLGEFILTRRAFTESFSSFQNLTVNQVVFILSVQYMLGMIDNIILSNILSDYLMERIKSICSTINLPENIFIAGMGSFGCKEMTFASDIDLIFAVKDIMQYPSVQSDFQKLLAELSTNLKPFEIDSRLRPEGKSSQLVWDFDKYLEYVEKRADIWEFQSLTRIDFIYGSRSLYDIFINKIQDRLNRIEKEKLPGSFSEMRKKIDKQTNATPQAQFKNFFNIKKSRGGIIDIEYALQFIILSHPETYKTCLAKNIYEVISILKNITDKSDNFFNFDAAYKNYSFMKNLELKAQIIFNQNSPVLPVDNNKRFLLAKEMNLTSVNDLEKYLTEVTKANRLFYDKIISTGEV